VARGALPRSRLVEQHVLTVALLDQRVAARASNVRVHAFQFELRPRVVIKDGGLPLVRVVATGTFGDFARIGELTTVSLGVAFFASSGCRLEIRLHELYIHVRRTMAIDTCDRPMCPL